MTSWKALVVIAFAIEILAPIVPLAFASVEVATVNTVDVTVDAALAKADQQIAAGLAFLKSKQNPDGSWGAENEPPAISALVLRAFARNDQTKDVAVAKGFEHLLGFQKPDGGIYRDTLGNYNTSIAITALMAAKDGTLQPAIDKAVAYVKFNQFGPTPDGHAPTTAPSEPTDAYYGGWGYGTLPANRTERPDLSNSQVALDALHDACIPANDPAYQRAVAFLTRAQNLKPSNDQPWAGTDGGFVYGPNVDHRGQSMAGEYTDADGGRLLRSYGSMTYAGLKSMIYAGLDKDDPRVKAAVSWIATNWTLDENPGMKLSNPESAKSGLYYYFHTLARAMAARGEPTLTLADGRVVDWRVDLVDKLGTLQQPDGSWLGDKRWMENNPILVTSYAIQALQEARDELKRQAR